MKSQIALWIVLAFIVVVIVLVPKMDEDTKRLLREPLELAAGCAVLIFCISYAIRSAKAKEVADGKRSVASQPYRPPQTSAPGKFQISGVDKETGMDTTDYINAESPENARAKAEIKGIVVTAVQRIR